MKARQLQSHARAWLDRTDWSRTPLGPRSQWPRSLHSHVAMIMELPTPAIIFWGDEQTQIYNDGYAVIMGPRHPRYFGASYRACWPDTYPLIYPWMRRVLDHGEVIEVDRERIPVTRYGFEEDAYFTFTFSPLRDDDGRIAGILQPVFDVSQSVLGERRSALLAQLAPDRLGAGTAAEVVRALDGAEDVPFSGLYLPTADGAVGRLNRVGGTGAWPAADDPALHRAATAAHERGEPVRVDGTVRAWALPLSAAVAGGTAGALVLGVNPRLHFDERYRDFLDATAHQVAASLQWLAARQADDRQRLYLHRLFEQAPAGIALLEGPDHVFALANPLYTALLGGRPLVGQPLRDAIPEMQGQPFLALLDAVYASGEPHVGTGDLASLRDAQGELRERWFNYVFQPLKDDAGTTTGILMLCYEVTEEVRQRQRSEALAEALQREHRLKDEFLAMLAHELRNPLAPIASSARLLGSGTLDAEATRRAGTVIARQAEHMTGLVGDLLDVSRVTRGLVEVDRLPVDLRQAVDDAVEQVRPLLEARGHRLAIEGPAQGPVVAGDHKRLVQIATNLLTNAAKYTPNGGAIGLTLAARGDEAELAVRDNGIGIAPELLPRMFDLFVQAERGSDRTEGGLGIGLALVRSLVELHGGRIACESAGRGHGSRFSVHLPVLADRRVPADTAVEQAGPGTAVDAAAPPPTLRILIVDDNVDAAQSLGWVLELEGHAVQVEHDARVAVDRALAFAPDVALLDIGLPHLDGCELARRFRQHPGLSGVRLLAVSGYGQPADVQRARAAGFDDYLVKPVAMPALRAGLGGAR